MFNSVGRRDMPLVSVATTNWAMSAALRSKISAVDLFPENMSSACKIGLLQHEYQCFELNNVYTKVIIHAYQLVYNKWMLVSTMFQWPLHIYIHGCLEVTSERSRRNRWDLHPKTSGSAQFPSIMQSRVAVPAVNQYKVSSLRGGGGWGVLHLGHS